MVLRSPAILHPQPAKSGGCRAIPGMGWDEMGWDGMQGMLPDGISGMAALQAARVAQDGREAAGFLSQSICGGSSWMRPERMRWEGSFLYSRYHFSIKPRCLHGKTQFEQSSDTKPTPGFCCSRAPQRDRTLRVGCCHQPRGLFPEIVWIKRVGSALPRLERTASIAADPY